MTARDKLDAYAEETDFERGDLLDDREHEAPKAFAALREVLNVARVAKAQGGNAWQWGVDIEDAIESALDGVGLSGGDR